MSSNNNNILNIHQDIREKLNYYQKVKKIPNIIFHGPSGSGKKTLVHDFIQNIYENDLKKIKNFVLYVNCAHGKGIKFIREELKFFSKTHIYSHGGEWFKSIVLQNADYLTGDAQSALRRCIELYSHSTRFFMIVEDKYKLLKPILSRFCEIYVPYPILEKPINLYSYNLKSIFQMESEKEERMNKLKKMLSVKSTWTLDKCMELSHKLVNKSYSGLDLLELLENTQMFKHLEEKKRYEFLISFQKVKKEFRNEGLLMLFMLNFIFLDTTVSLLEIGQLN